MTEPNVRWVEFRSYAGPSINDGVAIGPPRDGHVARAYWLTTKVETGAYFGRVMAYDGTCMTAGPDQHIAVFPKELTEEDWRAEDDQGSLWDLLSALRGLRGSDASFDAEYEALAIELLGDGFAFGPDGHPIYAGSRKVVVRGREIQVKAGDRAHGNVIRDTYTGPSAGKVPRAGAAWEKAKQWAILWHRLTVHPKGHQAQLDFGVNHLVSRTKRRRLGDLGTVESVVYGAAGIHGARLVPAMDLAVCVYHAHSVNGPAPAQSALLAAAKAHAPSADPVAFARDLLRRLGNNSFGRWDDDIEGGRYQRTRTHAKASGLWAEDLFVGPTAVMPKDLPG